MNEDDVQVFIKNLKEEIAEEIEANGNKGFHLDFSNNDEYCGMSNGFKITGEANKESDVYLCSVYKNSKEIGENKQFSFFSGSQDLK